MLPCLQLKFGTSLVVFRDEAQMCGFLTHYCMKDRHGKISLHHGIVGSHNFTELSPEYYANIPKSVKFTKRKKTDFMRGRIAYEKRNY